MNFFYTNSDAITMAKDHPKVLMRKMIVEYTQMLSTNKRLLDGELRKVWIRKITEKKQDDGSYICQVRDRLVDWYHLDGDEYEDILGRTFLKSHFYYKVSHANHPSTKWMRESLANYNFALKVTLHLCAMYKADHEDGNEHKTERVTRTIADNLPVNISDKSFSEPPAVVGELVHIYAGKHGVIEAYRECMRLKFKDWLSREKVIPVEFIYKPEWLTDKGYL